MIQWKVKKSVHSLISLGSVLVSWAIAIRKRGKTFLKMKIHHLLTMMMIGNVTSSSSSSSSNMNVGGVPYSVANKLSDEYSTNFQTNVEGKVECMLSWVELVFFDFFISTTTSTTTTTSKYIFPSIYSTFVVFILSHYLLSTLTQISMFMEKFELDTVKFIGRETIRSIYLQN